MEYTLSQILDVDLVQQLQDKLNAIAPFTTALVDVSGEILAASGWQDICTRFHRVNAESAKACTISDRYILDHLDEANPAVTYQCMNGMTESAVPIIIDNKILGICFTGQFFMTPPDLDYFRQQAEKYGYDLESYLDAVKQVPVWTQQQLNRYIDYIKIFTESLATTGLARLRQLETDRLAIENEQRFRMIVENTQAGYFFIDRSGIIRDVNDSWVRLYKYTKKEEVIGRHFIDVQRINDREKSIDLVARILNNEPESLSGEFSRLCQDGSIGWHTFSARPVVENQQTIGFEGFIIDITPQKQAEADRDLIRHRLQSVFEKMVEGFALHEIICDDHGVPVNYRFLDVNPAFERMTGVAAKDIIGKTALSVFPDLEPVWIEKYGKVALTGEPIVFENFAAPQQKFYHVVAFNNQKGQFVSIFTDITDRKQSETSLLKLALAIDSIQECVSMTDTADKIIFVNRAFCQTYGYTQEELLGNNIMMVRAPGENHNKSREILSQTLEGGWSGELMNRKKDGSLFLAHVSTSVVKDEDGQPVALIGVASDVTEDKKNQEELLAAKNKAEESDRLKSAFLANISHEIRTPMNSILGFTGLLEDMITDPKQQEYLKIIMTGGERLLNIINSVIDIAKIEAGQIDVNLGAFDVNQLMKELYDLNKWRNQAVKFINDNQTTQPLMLTSDRTKLFQILNNLITNALKFTKQGLVRYGHATTATHITFYVKDTGIGIPNDFKNQVFERFRKADLNHRTDFEGTGLGLAITKELVKLLNGEVWFDSEYGKGTMFFVRLPI